MSISFHSEFKKDFGLNPFWTYLWSERLCEAQEAKNLREASGKKCFRIITGNNIIS